MKNPLQLSFTTRKYQEFQTAQLEELLTQYGKIGEVWVDIPSVLPRCYREELLGMYLICRSRHTNLLLDVPPDKHGVVPEMHVEALMRLRKNLDKLGVK